MYDRKLCDFLKALSVYIRERKEQQKKKTKKTFEQLNRIRTMVTESLLGRIYWFAVESLTIVTSPFFDPSASSN